MTNKEIAIKDLKKIPGVGKSIAEDLWNIGIRCTTDLKGQDPELLYDLSNLFEGVKQDRCLLYVYRCAVYYADTDEPDRDPMKLQWWNWKDQKY
jgi:hypothetical protein